jgi:hypothetical protein
MLVGLRHCRVWEFAFEGKVAQRHRQFDCSRRDGASSTAGKNVLKSPMSLALGNMRVSVHGCTEMWSAEREVQTFRDFSAHATGFSQ